MSCQQRSIWNGFRPMRRPAQGSRVSSVPPSPMPVTLASVSTITTMLLCSSGICSGITVGASYRRMRVIFACGRAASALVKPPSSEATPVAAVDVRKARRFMERLLRGGHRVLDFLEAR